MPEGAKVYKMKKIFVITTLFLASTRAFCITTYAMDEFHRMTRVTYDQCAINATMAMASRSDTPYDTREVKARSEETVNCVAKSIQISQDSYQKSLASVDQMPTVSAMIKEYYSMWTAAIQQLTTMQTETSDTFYEHRDEAVRKLRQQWERITVE
jgi:hypothetical protein